MSPAHLEPVGGWRSPSAAPARLNAVDGKTGAHRLRDAGAGWFGLSRLALTRTTLRFPGPGNERPARSGLPELRDSPPSPIGCSPCATRATWRTTQTGEAQLGPARAGLEGLPLRTAGLGHVSPEGKLSKFGQFPGSRTSSCLRATAILQGRHGGNVQYGRVRAPREFRSAGHAGYRRVSGTQRRVTRWRGPGPRRCRDSHVVGLREEPPGAVNAAPVPVRSDEDAAVPPGPPARCRAIPGERGRTPRRRDG